VILVNRVMASGIVTIAGQVCTNDDAPARPAECSNCWN